jgi:hypothetical protein
VGQQTGVILPPTATNPRLESLQEDGKSPAIVVLCVIRRLALLWVEVLASRASVHASKPPARAAISGIVTAVPGPLRQRQPTSATKSAQSRRVPSRPSWISIGLAAIGAAIGSATIWATSALRHPASYVSTGIRTAAHSWGTVHGKYGSKPGVRSSRRPRQRYPRNRPMCCAAANLRFVPTSDMHPGTASPLNARKRASPPGSGATGTVPRGNLLDSS